MEGELFEIHWMSGSEMLQAMLLEMMISLHISVILSALVPKVVLHHHNVPLEWKSWEQNQLLKELSTKLGRHV